MRLPLSTLLAAALLGGLACSAQAAPADEARPQQRAFFHPAPGARHFTRWRAVGMPRPAGLDRNGDQALDFEEFNSRGPHRVALLFERLDRDDNGLISVDDEMPAPGERPRRADLDRAAIENCLEEAGLEIPSPAPLRLADADTGADGQLGLDELARMQEANARTRFTALDSDDDGLLTRDEFAAARSTLRAGRRAVRTCLRGETGD